MLTLSQAIVHMASKMLPDGFEVSDKAPQNYDELTSLLNSGKRMVVYSGSSDTSVYGSAAVNYAFRAWHDLCHWKGEYRFTPEGEAAACEMQCQHLLEEFGDTTETRRWCEILRAEIVGQGQYFYRHKRFPEDQRGFVAAYLNDREQAINWPFW